MFSMEQDLHMSVRKGDTSAVERLISNGTDINCLFYGWTPLQLAIDVGKQDMAKLLINSGCDVQFHDRNNRAPFEEAVVKKQPEVVKALMLKGVSGDILLSSGHTPLTYAVEKESKDLVQVLVQGGVDVNKINSQGQTAVYLAAKKGNEGLVKALVSAGADINQSCKEEGGSHTPLMAASASEHKQVVSYLSKQKGCDLDFQDSDGWTALWHAYSNASEDICAVLLRAGANKNLPNADGRSVVEDAMDNEDDVMIEVFQKFNNLM
ncbi:uncharacterized protein LOC143284248 [Babylonia areolata]|uniref:uncharacterized protein LOC143284248 n=1 Tax=Babylonia areolata TaxID=304850 RepID=UPI003FD0517B